MARSGVESTDVILHPLKVAAKLLQTGEFAKSLQQVDESLRGLPAKGADDVVRAVMEDRLEQLTIILGQADNKASEHYFWELAILAHALSKMPLDHLVIWALLRNMRRHIRVREIEATFSLPTSAAPSLVA